MSEVIRVLQAAERGEPKAASELLPLVYEELRRLAAQKMAGESPGQTLQPTALVHEAWLRLGGGEKMQKWDSRGHFFSAAAEAMRRILIDTARRKKAIRHGGNQQHVELENVEIAMPADADEVLALNEALDKLAAHDAGKAELVKLRYFVGMTIAEAAQALGISEPTAKRHWAYARAWIYSEIQDSTD